MAKAKTPAVEETETASETPKGKASKKPTANLVFEEWRMERTNGKLEKLKKLRSNVKITQETADTLNSGAESPDALNPIMYFIAE